MLPDPPQTLGLMGRLAKAMGRPINREARPLVGPAFKCLQDPKAMVGGPAGGQGEGVAPLRTVAWGHVGLHMEHAPRSDL